jgi:hypothetical protein
MMSMGSILSSVYHRIAIPRRRILYQQNMKVAKLNIAKIE